MQPSYLLAVWMSPHIEVRVHVTEPVHSSLAPATRETRRLLWASLQSYKTSKVDDDMQQGSKVRA